MPVLSRGQFGDLVDANIREAATEEFFSLTEDIIPHLFGQKEPSQPLRPDERYTEVSGLPRMGQFTGTLDYATRSQGYESRGTYVEFAQGVTIEDSLVRYDRFDVIADQGKALARSAYRNRQNNALRWLRNAFSVDTFFHTRDEGTPIFTNNHTTTTGVSTAAGFDNLMTTAFSAAALTSMQIQAHDIRDLQGHTVEVVIDTILAPIDLYDQVWETVTSLGKVDTAQNNRNVHFGQYDMIFLRSKEDFPDLNDWWGVDKRLLKQLVLWFDQLFPGGQPEFGYVEDFDTFNAKYRARMIYTYLIRDWRFGIGAQVS